MSIMPSLSEQRSTTFCCSACDTHKLLLGMTMKQLTTKFWIAGFIFLLFAGCNNSKEADSSTTTLPKKSYAVYAEFAKDSNIIMKNGLNRRVFDTAEAQYGSNIALEKDGSITLQPGTYHITGFSMVTMQTTFDIPVSKYNQNYPGYCLVYPKEYEQDNVLQHQVGIGTPGTALDMNPSLFDLVMNCEKETHLCVGHQSGDSLNNEVYLSVYKVAGIPSPYHVFARISIFQL